MSRFKPTPAYRIFLQLLVQARTAPNVTQEELATRLNLSPEQVAEFESGQRQIDIVQTMEWCVALGVSFLDFMIKLDEEVTAQISDAPAAEQAEGGAK